jgi:hypothetical protein
MYRITVRRKNMGLGKFLGLGNDDGLDCQDDGNGIKHCRAIKRDKNSLLATGTEFDIAVDKQCKAHLVGRTTILEENESIVKKAMKLSESECRGGIN